MKKLSFIKDKKYVAYAKKTFAMMKMIEMYLDYTKKSDTTVITPENLEELLIIFVFYNKKYQKKFQ